MNILNIKNAKKTFIAFIVTFVLIVIAIMVFYIVRRNIVFNEIELIVSNDIQEYSRDFERSISEVAIDVFLLDQIVTSIDTFTIGEEITYNSLEKRVSLEQGLLNWLEVKTIYDQVRIIDVNGEELLRINYNNGDPHVVPDELLQYKGDRYYFENSVNLPNDSLYLSQLDLNVENGEIEYIDGEPKQMLRLITPLYTNDNEQIGVLVVNYLVEDLFNSFKELRINEYSNFRVLNNEGYYLDHEDETLEYGFMYPTKLDETFTKYSSYPIFQEVSNDVLVEQFEGTLYTHLELSESRLAEVVTMKLGSKVDVFNETSSYIIVGAIDIVEIDAINNLIQLCLFFGMLGIIVSAVIARTYDEISFLSNQRLEVLEFTANHDLLTKLPNRLKFFEDAEYKLSRGKEFTLFFIDFDGFKSINDHYGHNIGDLALIEGAERINSCIRYDDLLARIGGDEFIVLLNDVHSEEVASRIATKMIEEFKKPFVLNGKSATMGLSIGIAFSDQNKNLETIYKESDEAMYKVKNSRKNNYHIYK